MYTIKDMPEQVPAEELELLSGVETATVGHWRLFGFMDRQIQPLLPGRRVVGTAVTLMDQAAQQTAALVEEATAAAQSLAQQAEQLAQAVAVFRLDAESTQRAVGHG